MSLIKRCQQCKEYTLQDTCSCRGKAQHNKPPKYSPQDRYGDYRRRARKGE